MSRADDLLEQMVEENRLLRLRLEQLETQSSWHSGGTRGFQEMPEHSPVSFAPGGMAYMGVQRSGEVAHESFLRAEADRVRALEGHLGRPWWMDLVGRNGTQGRCRLPLRIFMPGNGSLACP